MASLFGQRTRPLGDVGSTNCTLCGEPLLADWSRTLGTCTGCLSKPDPAPLRSAVYRFHGEDLPQGEEERRWEAQSSYLTAREADR